MTNLKFLASIFFALLLAPVWQAWAQLRLEPTLTVPESASSSLREVDFIVALVNSEPITRNEVQARQARLQAQWLAQGVSAPPAAEVFKRVLDQLINEKVIAQIGRDIGVRISNEQLNEALLDIGRRNGIPSLAALQAKYEAEGGNWNSYREDIRGELTRTQVREREVDGRVRVSEAEIDLVMQGQNQNQNSTPDINLAQILIALSDDPSPADLAAATQKAQSLIAQLRSGADFSKLAEQVSDAMDKSKGGVMGLRPADRYPELFVTATQNLAIGAISQPIRSGAGIHILKLLERSASNVATVTESRVRHILLPITAEQSEATAKSRMLGYKAQIEQGRASFTAIAREHSTDGSAAQGGDLGWAGPGLFVPEFERAMNALPTGKLSEPFTSRFGVHMLEVTDRRLAQVSLRDQRAVVQAQIRERKSAENLELWLTEARARAFIEYKNLPQ